MRSFLISIAIVINLIAGQSIAKEKPQLLIFLSSSLGENTFTAYLKQAENYNARILIRGLINDSFMDTINYTREMIKDKKISVDIDSNLFQLFSITEVPSFVLIKENDNCLINNCMPVHDKITGAIPLTRVMEIFAKDGQMREILQ